jgi:hypothetical protein
VGYTARMSTPKNSREEHDSLQPHALEPEDDEHDEGHADVETESDSAHQDAH